MMLKADDTRDESISRQYGEKLTRAVEVGIKYNLSGRKYQDIKNL